MLNEQPTTQEEALKKELKKKVQSLVASALAKRKTKREQKLAKIMEMTRVKGRIGNDEVQILIAVSDRTARRYLSSLVKQGKLKPVHGRGRWAHYVPARKNFQILTLQILTPSSQSRAF